MQWGERVVGKPFPAGLTGLLSCSGRGPGGNVDDGGWQSVVKLRNTQTIEPGRMKLTKVLRLFIDMSTHYKEVDHSLCLSSKKRSFLLHVCGGLTLYKF